MVFALLSLLFSGAIFGFFYAWVSSTMWGLDAADPQVAIAAMQAMNASVRNAVFAPAFFGTPLVLLVTALASRRASGAAALAFAAAAVVYTLGGLILTLAVNVPMNEALAQVTIPQDRAEAAAIWADYSPRWQVWNQVRTVASGLALLLAGWGTWRLGRDSRG
ncbi:anthrone oxygenase family protein [Paracoccus zhejiangensis]|uniref:DUF1772 domain-containing protein n=1 Tax=Paracoccus zhejiangensis TaxID=1077935 RepID=A0A2H5EV65_9RHOB|nr:anthrone oxygenase family protein [Paracoccus zhejiangensis]AUH63206.1 hypothetical protein CX676_02740 [Paracoccus zhejiangensis]